MGSEWCASAPYAFWSIRTETPSRLANCACDNGCWNNLHIFDRYIFSIPRINPHFSFRPWDSSYNKMSEEFTYPWPDGDDPPETPVYLIEKQEQFTVGTICAATSELQRRSRIQRAR